MIGGPKNKLKEFAKEEFSDFHRVVSDRSEFSSESDFSSPKADSEAKANDSRALRSLSPLR